MNQPQPARVAAPRIAIVGGGLAGLAAAAALIGSGARVTILEARRRAGGRAASFEVPVAGGLVDACQHVAMGCCTNFIDLCREVGLAAALRCDRTLWFIGPDDRRAACTPSRASRSRSAGSGKTRVAKAAVTASMRGASVANA